MGTIRVLLSRGLLLIFWSFVFWGTLLAGAFLWSFLTQGWAASLALFRPRGWEGWVNLLLVPFSLCVWCVVAIVLARIPLRHKRGSGGYPKPL